MRLRALIRTDAAGLTSRQWQRSLSPLTDTSCNCLQAQQV